MHTATSKVTTKGQIVIPKRIRAKNSIHQVDFLEAQIKSDKPSVHHGRVILNLAKVVYNPQSIWDPTDLEGVRKEPPPYGYERVMGILISCLDNTDWRVRSEAIHWLGTLGAQDSHMGEKVVALLEAQLAKEQASDETKEEKEIRRKGIENTLKDLRQLLEPPRELMLKDIMKEH